MHREKILEGGKLLITTIGTVITWLLGSWDTDLIVLIAFMAIDYVIGIIKAHTRKELSSDLGLHGIARKFLIILVLIVAVLLDRLLNTGNWVIRKFACYFYIANEGISILESAVILGVKVPKQLREALIQLSSNNSEK